MSQALGNIMEITESILWFSSGMLPTLAILEGVWRLSKMTPAAKVPLLSKRPGEVKLALA